MSRIFVISVFFNFLIIFNILSVNFCLVGVSFLSSILLRLVAIPTFSFFSFLIDFPVCKIASKSLSSIILSSAIFNNKYNSPAVRYLYSYLAYIQHLFKSNNLQFTLHTPPVLTHFKKLSSYNKSFNGTIPLVKEYLIEFLIIFSKNSYKFKYFSASI